MARVIHGAYTTVAASLAGLPHDTLFVSGRSTAVVNSSGAALDYQWSGYFAVASSKGSGAQVQIYSYAILNEAAYPGAVSGGGLVDLTGQKDTVQLLDSFPITTTACAVYGFGPYSIAKQYGGFPPPRHGLIFFQSTGDPFNASAQSHMVGYRTVEVSSA